MHKPRPDPLDCQPVISLAYAARPTLKDFVLALGEVVLDGRADDNLTIIVVRPKAAQAFDELAEIRKLK